MEGFLVIGSSAATSAGNADRMMKVTAATAPRPALVLWYTDWQGLSRAWEAVSDQSSGEQVLAQACSNSEAES